MKSQNWSQWAYRLLAVSVTFAIFATVYSMYFESKSAKSRAPFVVPDLQLKDHDGKLHSLKEYRGKVVVVNFWASWCGPCLTEFPSLKAFASQYQKDVVVLAASQDTDAEAVRQFLRPFEPLPSNMIMLQDFDNSVSRAWGVYKLPESFILDKNLSFVEKFSGSENWMNSDVTNYFDSLIAK